MKHCLRCEVQWFPEPDCFLCGEGGVRGFLPQRLLTPEFSYAEALSLAKVCEATKGTP